MAPSPTPIPASQAPFPSFTSTWHQTSYSSISPLAAANSALNKTVLITGGGSGIGAATARAFAAAGAKHIAILGRTESKLLQTKAEIEALQPEKSSSTNKTTIWTYAIDANDQAAVDGVLTQWNASLNGHLAIDVLVLNAGYCDFSAPIASTPAADWMKGITGNLYGPLVVTQAFLRYANATPEPGSQTTVINVASLASFILVMPGISAYSVGKQAGVTLMGCLQLEHPELRVVSVHPGGPDSEMQQRAGVAPQDDVSLSGDFNLWLAGTEAGFLKGKYVFANWDVEEMKARKEEIIGGRQQQQQQQQNGLLEMWIDGLPRTQTTFVMRDGKSVAGN